jgi:polyisoprenoid-binding protein YceI
MTIRGITLPISIVATVKEEGDSLIAKASFALNRADWEIKYNSASFFSNLGDRIIRDAIVIGLDLKAQKVIE